MPKTSVWVGFDPRESDAFMVAKSSIWRNARQPVSINGIVLPELQSRGFYTRPTSIRINSEGRSQMWDDISDAAMSTQHANARFLVPILAREGWALFVDGDILARADVHELFGRVDNSKAVMCVKHDHKPASLSKMDGQFQSRYARKNWSSVVLFNCDHPSNSKLTIDLVNTVPGRDLHRFCWLEDDEIGELDPSWNYLVGHSDKSIKPKIVHFTDGTPSMPGYEKCEYADEWRAELYQAAA